MTVTVAEVLHAVGTLVEDPRVPPHVALSEAEGLALANRLAEAITDYLKNRDRVRAAVREAASAALTEEIAHA